MKIRFNLHSGETIAIDPRSISMMAQKSSPGGELTWTNIYYNEPYETPEKTKDAVMLHRAMCVGVKESLEDALFMVQVAVCPDHRDPIVLSIRDTRELACVDIEEPFLFEVGGKPYFFGSLQECMESRHAYAVGCDQNQVPYTMTDLPEPYKSDLEDFHANPVIGGGLKAAEAVPADQKPSESDPMKLVSTVDSDWTKVAVSYSTYRGKTTVKAYDICYKGEPNRCTHLPHNVQVGDWEPVTS